MFFLLKAKTNFLSRNVIFFCKNFLQTDRNIYFTEKIVSDFFWDFLRRVGLVDSAREEKQSARSGGEIRIHLNRGRYHGLHPFDTTNRKSKKKLPSHFFLKIHFHLGTSFEDFEDFWREITPYLTAFAPD